MQYTVKYNRSAVHIAGIAEVTRGGEFNYSRSACPGLARVGHRMAIDYSFGTLAEAVSRAESIARGHGVVFCGHCAKAASRL